MKAHAIEFKDVWKVFGTSPKFDLASIQRDDLSKEALLERHGCVAAVAGVSFKVEAGEIFCVMGLSGSGKSTLVRHVNRLIKPSSGQIIVGGEDINLKSENEMRELRARSMGMVFQNVALLPHRTVRDNVALSLELRKASVRQRYEVAEEKLELVQLAGWGDRYPDQLSGGMKQRVGLARALAADPAILLMDEPFSALDPLIRRELQDEFKKLSTKLGKTTLFITHDLDEAIRLGHQIGVMKDGKMLQIGSADDILGNPKDPYVEKFVQGSSRLKLLRAESVMLPLAEFASAGEHLALPDAPRLSLDAPIKEMLDLSHRHGNMPLVVVDANGVDVGIVTASLLLRGVHDRL
ncbi:betaine/proline/choline family ABC transporter ATP-binding protein [Mesorhizobium sp. YC-39]|uniref:quaternary amine ABC transporter ATP-binding protein n=1 Tax=unclassified Mesorhizobium TaxID=325217 RepID=UPI0021E95F51|nr:MULTISPECIES: betaine/proline/choline family ABC transporter ATP-binding protein [unclassified Mesorhizobium]MCV3211871.1 betaine/proline/choline family ABC transporter ATP-binding protein [Mesorhizobium sp. YC-2]MCV3233594.1 betaine/proline/choline family ABC transporter ATP-binding protein [Mesorhizobium sp. YC-39]